MISLLKNIAPLFGGFVFALGLGVSGMTDPQKVLSFLDVFGNWDPTLLFVMVGAIAVYSVFFRMSLKLPKPVLAAKFIVPTRKDFDSKLVVGSILFGAGWGLAGFCPAPALVSLASGSMDPAIFVIGMFLGMAVFRVTEKKIDQFLLARKLRKKSSQALQVDG